MIIYGSCFQYGKLPLNCAVSPERLCVDNLIDLFSLQPELPFIIS